MTENRITNKVQDKISYPRILVSALSGSGAKTIVSIGLIVSFKRRGLKILPFKKGPDYIDAAWLTAAAGKSCRHLDLYLMGEDGLRKIFYDHINPDAISIIEGNRGLFDGVDIHGTYSTARIASLLEIPVLLIIDCSKTTNTAAALVKGCQVFDDDITLGGIILNRISGKRHADVISKSIEYHTGLPILGKLPNLEIHMPERHLGLTTVNETSDYKKKFELLGDYAEKYLDLDKILDIAKNTSQVSIATTTKTSINQKQNVIIGIIKDSAFQFYYPENIEALEREGAKIVEFNSLEDKEIKPVDLLYIGGGFPEVHAENISKNKSFRDSIKKYAEKGMPIYGECGAVIYLGRSVIYDGIKYQMCGIFQLDFELTKKPAGHGYTNVTVDQENPFFPKGLKLKGHEFHYSVPKNWKSDLYNTAMCMDKGFGFDGKRDGIFNKNVFATYTHLHAAGAKDWAKQLVKLAMEHKFTESIL